LNGFFIYPDGRSKHFSVTTGSSTTVLIPWSSKDYILAFSGAVSSAQEIGYSFCLSTSSLADLSGTWTAKDGKAYEPNNKIAEAYQITNLETPTKAFLGKDDIDFYKINISNCSIK